jgi:hypothetical protein
MKARFSWGCRSGVQGTDLSGHTELDLAASPLDGIPAAAVPPGSG